MNETVVAIGFVCLLVLFSIYMIIRINRVFQYRMWLINEISKEASKDIDKNRDWRWRYKRFDDVSFDTMLYKFWKPVESFYPDITFIKESSDGQ